MNATASPHPAGPLGAPADSEFGGVGRKAHITRGDIMSAALRLLGPHRALGSLSLREVAREAGIAPNSFYRHFRDVDELAVALIDEAGRTLREIVGEARTRAVAGRSVVRGSVEAFMEQLDRGDRQLHLLLREGAVGADAVKQAVERQLGYFEAELEQDLVRLAQANGTPLHAPAATSRAITRLVFAIGALAMDQPAERRVALTDELELMVRMIVTGTQMLGEAERGSAA